MLPLAISDFFAVDHIDVVLDDSDDIPLFGKPRQSAVRGSAIHDDHLQRPVNFALAHTLNSRF